MDGKPVVKSRTIWFNVLAVVVLIANMFGFGEFELDAEVIAGVTAIVNFLLRFITKEPLKMKG